MRRAARLGLAAAAIAGLVAALFPFAPVLEWDPVVRTRMHRLDHTRLTDFAVGEVEGGLVLIGPEDAPTLTLAAPGEGAFTSSVFDLTLPATSLAAHWTQAVPPGAHVHLEVRASPDGLSWMPWQELEGEGFEPLGGAQRVFGTLAASEGARYGQYRLTLEAPGGDLPAVHAVSVFALDSASDLHHEPSLRLGSLGQAEAAIKPLGIVARKQWGADESLRFKASENQERELIWPAEVTSVEKIVVHHTAGPNVCASRDAYCQRRSVIAVNDIYYFHTVVNEWGDIGYNSLVGYDGRIYEGRHGPEPLDNQEPVSAPVVAGHAFRYNNRSHGIALLGNFEQEPVPDLQYESLASMVGWIVRSQLVEGGQVDPLGASDYRLADGQVHPRLPNIVGHRDVFDTECPGEHLYAMLDDLRVRAKRIVEWPPIHVELEALPDGETVTYHVLVENHEPELVRWMTIKGAVPPNAEFVDSWAGAPYTNRGGFDGSTVTWHDPDATLDPGRDRRHYAFVVRPRPGVPRADVRTVAWVEFADPARGIAMSEQVSADQPLVLTVDALAGGRTSWMGDWPLSRNVAGHFGDGYQVHDPGDGSAVYTWQAQLPEPGAWEVLAWWTAAIDRATDAPYTVHAADGARTVRVNQKERGARWVSLGTFDLAAGPVRVTLSDAADGVVIADAVRFRKGPVRPVAPPASFP